MKTISVIVLSIAVIPFLLTSCGDDRKLTIAEQYGLAYAPLQIMRQQQYLENLEPEVEVEWVKLGNTAAIREAVLAGEVEIGVMGLPPFLIGADKGMDWKLVSGMSICPVGLVAGSDITSIYDLKPEHKIALPQPGSIQHILLSMASEREFGNAAEFDNSLVTMKHPDGMTALLSGAVDAHFTSPPYIFLENDAESPDGTGYSTVLTGFDAFGGKFSFIGTMASGPFLRDNPQLLQSFLKALQQSIDFINSSPEEAASILSGIYDLPEAQLLGYLTDEGMKYTLELYGLEKFIKFMKSNGYLDTDILPEDVVYNE